MPKCGSILAFFPAGVYNGDINKQEEISMIRWYKNSFLASVVSIIGCLIILGGIASFSESIGGAIALIIAGLALAVWGKNISDNKAFKTWWQQVVDAGLVPQIAQNTATAIAIYNKNPQHRTLNKIRELNPAAAQQIAASIAAKKKK